jgi:predicted 3-demethylubiquinone-9 3-methyltransferase (glyoxalase superfamily)
MADFQKIKTFLWYDKEAEEAANHYIAAFENSKIDHIERLGEIGPKESGSIAIVEFTLAGQQFVAMNAGPMFKFNEAISMFVLCDDQAEIDRLWTHLLAGGGKEQACGWLKDKFGLSWQIVPKRHMEMMRDPDKAKRDRVMAAMMQMVKFDIAALEKAYAGS